MSFLCRINTPVYSNWLSVAPSRITVISWEESNFKADRMRFWVKWSAWLCLSLMLWTAAAEPTHNHPNQADSASCLICVAAHSASPAPNSANTAPSFAAVGSLHEETIVANVRFEFSDHSNRGPPAL